jgi:hypothetical protein
MAWKKKRQKSSDLHPRERPNKAFSAHPKEILKVLKETTKYYLK